MQDKHGDDNEDKHEGECIDENCAGDDIEEKHQH